MDAVGMMKRDLGRPEQQAAKDRLGFGLGARGEVFANPLSGQPAGNAENDLPGGIREF
jgi:hypothetical protein